MEKQEMQQILEKQILAMGDFIGGYKACAKFVLECFDKKESDGTGIQTNQGNSEVA